MKTFFKAECLREQRLIAQSWTRVSIGITITSKFYLVQSARTKSSDKVSELPGEAKTFDINHFYIYHFYQIVQTDPTRGFLGYPDARVNPEPVKRGSSDDS